MFNGYNDSALISYEFNQEREKKSDSVSKFSYGHDGGMQSTPTQPNNRQSEFWSGKPNFIGIPNVVKCNCTNCYPATENQSYQVESARHRPWLSKTFSVPLSGSNECKLPACQWDSTLNQICYSDSNIPYGQENEGKHPYYRQFQIPNQPSVIISENKQKSEMGYQTGIRQPVMCNPGYDLAKRINGRSYYDGDKYSLGAYSINQIPRLPVEPYTKAVPSNLNQNRVPSVGLRKENSSQYDDYNGTKICSENYHAGLSPVDLKNSGIHLDYSYFNRDTNYYTEMRRNSLATQNRKDCAVTQPSLEQHYSRSKHPENLKGYDMFYPNLEKNQMDTCTQRIENDGINRISRSVMVCNDFRYADEKRPQVFPYQNNVSCRNYIRPEYPQFNSQFAPGFQESDKNQCRTLPQQLQNYDHPQVNNNCPQKNNSDKTQSFGRSQVVLGGQPKSNYLESVRSEDLPKNGTNKISPLRLLRKKKFVTAPQEVSSAINTVETPALDVRKFWSTWAEEDENICPTEVVVLDCQNIDPEQAKLLNFYETDSSRPISLENVIIKNPNCSKDNIENVKSNEEPVDGQEKQVEISTQIEPVIKNANEINPDPEVVNTFSKKFKSQEHRKKKTEELTDKWTEKKFDFLKKSEESKAAKYEEEKKRIFERRMSFQQIGVNKIETPQEDVNKFEENSQSSSLEEKITTDLPTSEYRRNKFLDYSEVMVKGFKNNQKLENKEVDESNEVVVKKEEPNFSHDKNSSAEMNDILKKISEINFQETKSESDILATKKAKKAKKKKLDQQEGDARTGLKLETMSKPTIKFSIQKSHDLKISFKVLNKKYEEEAQIEETKPIADANTELITLKYKSIQNGSKMSDSKKTRKKLRRKKHAPILKIKKSKHMEERDPLVEDDKAKIYPTDDFQVQETVDSAKIKLTFKRHKANLQTEYKINNEGFDAGGENYKNGSKDIEKKYKKRTKKVKRSQIVDQTDIESTNSTEQNIDVDIHSEGTSKNDLESVPKIYPKNSSTSVHPCLVKEEEEIHENPTTPPEATMLEKRLCKFIVQNDVMKDSKCEINGEKHVQLIVNYDEANGSNDKGDKFSPVENVKYAILECSEDEKTEEKIQEISLDFIRRINSTDIEKNLETEKTEEIEASDTAEERDRNGGAVFESTNENHSNVESSYCEKNNSHSSNVNADPVPISVYKTNPGLESNFGKNVNIGVSEENITFGKRATESGMELENVYSFQKKSEEHITSKFKLVHFGERDSIKERVKNFQSNFENDVEPEISNVGNSKPKIGLEDISVKTVDLERLENYLERPDGDSTSKLNLNHEFDVVDSTSKIRFESTLISRLECLEEEADSEPDPLHLINNEKQSKMNIDEEILLNGNILQPNCTTIVEGDSVIDNSETSDDRTDQFLNIERNSKSESQGIDLPKLENEKFKIPTEGKGDAEGFSKGERKTSSVKFEPDNCVQDEKEEKFNQIDTVKANNNKYSCVRLTSHAESERIKSNDSLNRHYPSSDNAQVGDKNFALDCQNADICDNLRNKNIDENIQPESVQLNMGSIILDSSTDQGIDQVISSSDDINDDNGNTTEPEVEMICDSQNKFFSNSTTQIDSFSPTLDEAIENSCGVEAEDCSQFKNEKPPTPELPETNHFSNKSVDSTQSGAEPENCNQELYCEETKFGHTEKEKNEIVDNFEDSAVNLEEGKSTEVLLLNNTVTSSNDQEIVLVIKSVHQSDSFSNVASPVIHSKENFCMAGSTEIKMSDKADPVYNSSSIELEYNSLELPANLESDLEDGEIVDDSSEDSESNKQPIPSEARKAIEFKIQKPKRRCSINFYNIRSHSLSSWRQRKFTKSKSCPPKFKIGSVEYYLTTTLEDIPLPVGPPPRGSCFGFNKINKETEVNEVSGELKEKYEKISTTPVLILNEKDSVQELSHGSPFVGIELQNCRNSSPPVSDALGIQRSKIRFSLIKRSRFSKIGLQTKEPKSSETPKFVEKSDPKVKEPAESLGSKVTKVVKEPERECIKPADEPDQMFKEVSEKPDFNNINNHQGATEEHTVEPGKETDLEPIEAPQKLAVTVTESLESLERKLMEFSESSELETVEFSEQIEKEVVDSSIDTKSDISVFSNKIRTPDYVSETVDEISECQITEVPNGSTIQANDKDQKNDTEVESLCEDANIEVVDVMTDFMRDEFYDDIPTSEDLPNGDSADEKVNDDKFRNIMQNCLENAKKFLNVGNLKLFSCSVDDLLELDNQENEPTTNHISRDVLLTSCEDINDDLGLNEKFQPVDISMEFIPSDVCPEILPVDNWPYLEEEVPSSPLKLNETDLIPESTVSETVSYRKRTAKESENYKRFRRKSLIGEEETLGSKIAAHRRKTIDSFLSYTKLKGVDKPNESLKCQLSLEKLTKNGVEFISSENDFPKKRKDIQSNKKLNYKSPLWQPKVRLIRISDSEVKRFRKTKIRRPSSESGDTLLPEKKQKFERTNSESVENKVILSISEMHSIKGMITTSSDVKKHKPRFRNLHTKRKTEQDQTHPKAIENALSELFKDFDRESKNYKSEETNKNMKDAESKIKSESKSDRHSSKSHSHKSKHDHRDRRREKDKEYYRQKEKHRHERSKHDSEKRHKSNYSGEEKKRSMSKSSSDEKKDVWACEVCGFDDASERVAHIKNHPFHCQSCHLAFKTESYFTSHLTEMHKDIRNQHHCLLCEMSFDTEEDYQCHLETREHTHIEAVEKNTINTLFTLLTGAPCPVLGVVEMKPEWLPNQPGTVHFYHQATPLSLALQYLKMHHELTSYSEVSKENSN